MEPRGELPFGACFQVLAQTLDNGESLVLQVECEYRTMSARKVYPLGKGEHRAIAIQRVVCRCPTGAPP